MSKTREHSILNEKGGTPSRKPSDNVGLEAAAYGGQ